MDTNSCSSTQRQLQEVMAVWQYDTPLVIEDDCTKIRIDDTLYSLDTFWLALEYTHLEYDEAIERLGYIND